MITQAKKILTDQFGLIAEMEGISLDEIKIGMLKCLNTHPPIMYIETLIDGLIKVHPMFEPIANQAIMEFLNERTHG